LLGASRRFSIDIAVPDRAAWSFSMQLRAFGSRPRAGHPPDVDKKTYA